LIGDPWGRVLPPRPFPPPTPNDGRTVALRILAQYISELTFLREGAINGPPIAVKFQGVEKDIHIGWPDSPQDMTFPAIVFLAGHGNYDVIGLTAYVEEDTRDVFAPGTVVQWQHEYREAFQIEIWASSKPELRAVLSGLETAFVPVEQMVGIRFRMPDYYNEPVVFTLESSQRFDEPDAVRNRFRARVEVEMRFTVVQLVNYVPLTPIVTTDVKQPGDAFDTLAIDPQGKRI